MASKQADKQNKPGVLVGCFVGWTSTVVKAIPFLVEDGCGWTISLLRVRWGLTLPVRTVADILIPLILVWLGWVRLRVRDGPGITVRTVVGILIPLILVWQDGIRLRVRYEPAITVCLVKEGTTVSLVGVDTMFLLGVGLDMSVFVIIEVEILWLTGGVGVGIGVVVWMILVVTGVVTVVVQLVFSTVGKVKGTVNSWPVLGRSFTACTK